MTVRPSVELRLPAKRLALCLRSGHNARILYFIKLAASRAFLIIFIIWDFDQKSATNPDGSNLHPETFPKI